MTSRVLASGVAVAVALSLPTTVGAQDQVLRLGEVDPQVAQLKQDLRTFGGVIEAAIKIGGDSLANRARMILPDLELFMDGTPVVSAVQVPDVGLVFDVQIPDVNAASLQLFTMLRNNQLARPANGGGVRPAAASPAASALMDFDVGREYGDYVRDALVNAMLNFASALPLEPHERLIIVGRVPQRSALALQPDSRKLVLQLLAADLLALREGSISRDEALARIIESRF